MRRRLLLCQRRNKRLSSRNCRRSVRALLSLLAGCVFFTCCTKSSPVGLSGLTPCARRAAGREVRYYLQTAHGCLRLIRLSTMEIIAPWLTQEMAHRIASTLNYFLLHLTGALAAYRLQRLLRQCKCGLMLR